jgi:hypothetical protein
MIGLGCHDKPLRNMRPTQEQRYDLPGMDQEQFSKPPTYPEEKRMELQPKKENGPPNGAGGMRGTGPASMGTGGPGMGNPGNF